jgi:hypothetical protein
MHERNWWEEGRSAKDLGLLGLALAQIKEYVTSGNRRQRAEIDTSDLSIDRPLSGEADARV